MAIAAEGQGFIFVNVFGQLAVRHPQQLAQEHEQRGLGQLVRRDVLAHQAHQRAEHENVLDAFGINAGRHIAPHPRHGQDIEPLFLQRWDDLGIEQRGLARARLGIKEHHPLGLN